MRSAVEHHHGDPIPVLHWLAVHGLNLVIGLGAGAGAVAVAAGGVLAFLYGRRASASVSAEVHSRPEGYLVIARPVIRAVGLYRVKFQETDGVMVRLREVHLDNDELVERECMVYPGAFGQQYVDAGEELSTSVTFPPLRPPESVIGWLVFLDVAAPTWLARFRTGVWRDQTFIPRPTQES